MIIVYRAKDYRNRTSAGSFWIEDDAQEREILSEVIVEKCPCSPGCAARYSEVCRELLEEVLDRELLQIEGYNYYVEVTTHDYLLLGFTLEGYQSNMSP